ncbi:MAG: gamma-butyrobetaine hydroxylase-like domain-containing protein [Nitrososphaerales archaeon]
MEPVGLEVSEEGTIFISWSDGHRGRHAPFALRSACPCAMCHGEPGIFGKYYQVPGTQIKADVQPEEIESVGRYGLKILWSDGHDIGIYTYEYLRRLCECEECRVSKSG